MDSRLALMFAAMLLSTAAGTLHTMFGSAQTENVAYTILCIILGCLYVPKQYTKACCITFSHAIAVRYVPAIGYHHTKRAP